MTIQNVYGLMTNNLIPASTPNKAKPGKRQIQGQMQMGVNTPYAVAEIPASVAAAGCGCKGGGKHG